MEYHGDLLLKTDAKKKEAVYAQDPATGCYMYYFQYLSKTYWYVMAPHCTFLFYAFTGHGNKKNIYNINNNFILFK